MPVDPTTVRLAPAGLGTRVAAAVVDELLESVCCAGIYLAGNFGDARGLMFAGTVVVALRFACWSQWSATPGMLLFGLAIVDDEDQGRLPMRRFAKRWLASWLSSVGLGLGYLWALLDDRNQTLHDRLARTLVIPRHEIRFGRRLLVALGLILIGGVVVVDWALQWAKEHTAESYAAETTAIAAGSAFGRQHDGPACLAETFARSNACDSLVCRLSASRFLQECMKVTAPATLGCEQVPSPRDPLAMGLWQSRRCDELNQADPWCSEVLQELAKACAARGVTKAP